MPAIAQIGSVVTVTPSEEIQIVHGRDRHEFIDDRSPFALKVSGVIEEDGRLIGVYGEAVSGHERYKGLIVSLLIRLDRSDWKRDNRSAANFIVGATPAKPNGKHPFSHPEGMDVEGFPYILRFGSIDSSAGAEQVVNSAKAASGIHPMRYNVKTLKEDGNDFITVSQQDYGTSLVEFFFGELGSAWFGLVPPLHVLNYFLAHGGFGRADQNQRGIHYIYEWTPFAVTPEQYPQIIEELRLLPDRPFAEIQPPSEVQSVPEYEHWAFVRWMNKKQDDYQKQKGDA